MIDSSDPPHPLQTMKPHQIQYKRLCDYCNDTTAILYCRADSAKLCLACDREVHSTNQLFVKHTRWQLCDACENSPASIFCETEQSVFCQNCDWESHSLSSLSSPHNRRPVEGFSGRPSVTELLTVLGFEDLCHKKTPFGNEESDGRAETGLEVPDLGDAYSDFLFWGSSAVVSIDDLIVSSSDSGQNFQALGVPPLPKNRNAACGQHKGEILCQLRELARSEPDLNYDNAYFLNYENADTGPTDLVQATAAGQNVQSPNLNKDIEPDAIPECEENLLHWFSDFGEAAKQAVIPRTLLKSNSEENYAILEKQSDIGGCKSHANGSHEAQPPQPITTSSLSVFPKVASHEVNSQERETAISRYKEKKKTRRYDKHIRYESRKARAEGRTRIRGRFAKMDN